MSSQRETVRRPKGGGGLHYLGIAILVASPVCLFLRPLTSRLVKMSRYVLRHVFVALQVRLSLKNAPHDGTQSDLEYSTGRLTWKMDPKVYLEVYYHLHFFTGKTQGIKLPVSMISMQTRSFARLYEHGFSPLKRPPGMFLYTCKLLLYSTLLGHGPPQVMSIHDHPMMSSRHDMLVSKTCTYIHGSAISKVPVFLSEHEI